jgi:hypothetical protein
MSFALAIGIASTSRAAIAAPAEAAPAAPLPEYVQLEVADSVMETDLVRSWASEAIGAGLDDAGVDKAVAGRSLSVAIAGVPFDYEVTIGVKESADWVGDLRSGRCKCDDAQLVKRVREDVGAVAGRLQPAAEPATTATPATVVPATPDAGKRAPLGGKGKAGIALLVVGAGGVIAGAVVLALGKSEGVASEDPSAVDDVDRRPAGAAVLAVGGVLVIVGATLLGLDRRDAKRKRAVSIAPAASRTSFGLGISGRF